MTLRVPVTKARTAGLRKLATRKLFDEALNVLRGKARVKRTHVVASGAGVRKRKSFRRSSGDRGVVRDLPQELWSARPELLRRQIYEAAMDRLAAELGALDKTDKQTAITKLTDFLKTV